MKTLEDYIREYDLEQLALKTIIISKTLVTILLWVFCLNLVVLNHSMSLPRPISLQQKPV